MFGCIQTSFFIGKILFKIDVKNKGSKNAGASNGVLLFGWAYGVFIGLVDLMKAYIPVSICLTLTQFDMFLASIVGGGVILGHIYPFFMKFNGGKGMSSYFGMILALDFSFGMTVLNTRGFEYQHRCHTGLICSQPQGKYHANWLASGLTPSHRR